MDVHAPHEPVHTWKDFILHLATITIGLFIALSLEGLVDYVHHRHLLREARENIRQEIEDNHKAVQKDIVSVQKDIDTTNADIDTIRKMRADPKNFKGSLNYSMQFSSPSDAAWNSARDTGALSLMPYKEVQRYADIYENQKMVNDQVVEIFHRQTLALAPAFMEKSFDKIPENQTEALLHDTAATLIDLSTLKQIVQALDTQYVAELKK